MSCVEAWWYRSRWWWEGWTSLNRQSGPKRWLAYDGVLNTNWQSNILRTTQTATWLLGHFGVSKNRMPTTPAHSQYISAPDVVFDDGVAVTTRSANGVWPVRNHPSAEIGYKLTHSLKNGSVNKKRTKVGTFVDISNNHWQYESGQFGRTRFPPIQFSLKPNRSLHVDLKVEIWYNVEGETHLILGASDEPFRMRLPQYDICPHSSGP